MTVHDRTRLIGQFRLLNANPAQAGFLLYGAAKPAPLPPPDAGDIGSRPWLLAEAGWPAR